MAVFLITSLKHYGTDHIVGQVRVLPHWKGGEETSHCLRDRQRPQGSIESHDEDGGSSSNGSQRSAGRETRSVKPGLPRKRTLEGKEQSYKESDGSGGSKSGSDFPAVPW